MKKIMAVESLNPAHGLLICEDTGIGPVKSKRIGQCLAEMEQYEGAAADARYIVEAVNAYKHVSALLLFGREVESSLGGFREGYSGYAQFGRIEESLNKLKAAIAASATKGGE